jgi:hypothetical protein
MTMLLGYAHMVDFFTAFDWWRAVTAQRSRARRRLLPGRNRQALRVYLPRPASVTLDA